MGRSRVKRGLQKSAPKPQVATQQVAKCGTVVNPPIPDITNLDMAFGKIDHMPRYETVPAEFKQSGNNYAAFVSKWFFSGLKQDDLARLTPRPGVVQNKALAAIRAIICSFEPKHEHKEAGCAFLLHAWFELKGAAP